MAPSAPPPTASPLPRRPAPAQTRAARAPRLVTQDGVWMAALALLAAAVAFLLPHPPSGHWRVGAAFAAVTVALLYLLGWRTRDRAAGIAAALLTATSLPFALHAIAVPRDALFALLGVAALFSFVAGSSLAALALAGLACAARADGLLLGAVLLGLALVQRRRRAALGALAFAALAGAGWALQDTLWRLPAPSLRVGPTSELLVWTVSSGMAFLSWLLLPFCAELGEKPRRARWLPVLLWTAAYFVAESVVRVGSTASVVFALTPLWFTLAGGGLSRLLPALTGEFRLPWVRYALATLALLSLVAIRLRAEWPRTPHPAPPAPVAVKPTAPVAVKPTAPVAVKPTALVAVKPTAPVAVKPTAPVAVKPTAPVAVKPTAPVAVKPTAPVAVKPTAPVAVKPTAPVAVKPTAPVAVKPTALPPTHVAPPKPPAPVSKPQQPPKPAAVAAAQPAPKAAPKAPPAAHPAFHARRSYFRYRTYSRWRRG